VDVSKQIQKVADKAAAVAASAQGAGGDGPIVVTAASGMKLPSLQQILQEQVWRAGVKGRCARQPVKQI
jgi:hypothetical protein